MEFVMKVDDDSFVNVPNLIHFLLGGTIPIYNATLYRYTRQNNQNYMSALNPNSRLKQQNDLLIGSMVCHNQPCALPNNKW